MEVDRERRNLLGEAEEVDRSVQEVRLELRVEVDGPAFLEHVREVGDVHEGDNVEGELQEHRQQHIEVEDVS